MSSAQMAFLPQQRAQKKLGFRVQPTVSSRVPPMARRETRARDFEKTPRNRPLFAWFLRFSAANRPNFDLLF